jgi:predicted nucleic acid-binding protein
MLDKVAAGKVDGFTCETNIAELYYKNCEKFGRNVAEIRQQSIRHSRISVLPIDERLTRIAGSLKCTYRGKLSMVDAYILAVGKMLNGTLVTTDPRLKELKILPTELLSIP